MDSKQYITALKEVEGVDDSEKLVAICKVLVKEKKLANKRIAELQKVIQSQDLKIDALTDKFETFSIKKTRKETTPSVVLENIWKKREDFEKKIQKIKDKTEFFIINIETQKAIKDSSKDRQLFVYKSTLMIFGKSTDFGSKTNDYFTNDRWTDLQQYFMKKYEKEQEEEEEGKGEEETEEEEDD